MHPDFKEVRSRILGHSPLPSLLEVYAEVKREESSIKVMTPTPEIPVLPSDSSAFISKNAVTSNSSASPKGKPICDHCKKPGHTRDKCWELYGKPADWKPRKSKPRGNQVSHESSQPSQSEVGQIISSDQITQLLDYLKILQTQQKPSSSGTVAHKGTCSAAINDSFLSSKWIVDSGASDHMTSDAKMFVSYLPLSGKDKIKTANGSSSTIAGSGTINLSDSLKLESVLHVPHLACNLLSISKLTKQANCSAHFFSTLSFSGSLIGDEDWHC